jgi:hypothetical protein
VTNTNIQQGQDPTGGFVEYVPFEIAAGSGLIGNNSGLVYVGEQADVHRGLVRLGFDAYSDWVWTLARFLDCWARRLAR